MLDVLATLPGLIDKHPVHCRRLRAIRRRAYRRVADLDAEVVRSPEPIPFADLDRGAFRPIRAGAEFGGVQECAWLHITGDVPPATSVGGESVVMLGIRGEGIVYSAGGIMLDAVTTVWTQGDLPQLGGGFRPVPHADLSTRRVELYADVTFNGFLFLGIGRGVFHGAHIAVRDDTAAGLYYDYLALAVLALSTDDASLARDLQTGLREAYARFSAGDAAAARARLATELARPSTSDFVYSAVGHGHLDMAWVWPIRETQRKAVRTYLRALQTIDRYDDYVYGTSQPQQLLWTKQQHPELYEKIQDAVAAGRIEPQGSFWVEPDTNLPGGESLIRQALVGRRFWQDEFGLDDDRLRLCWLPDTFGYNGNLPQILRGCGMDWFLTIKLSWNRVTDFGHRTFEWAGIDGTSVLVHMPPEGDYNSRAAADGLLRGIAQYPERDLGTALLVYGAGDGGGGPGEQHLELLARESSLRGLPRVQKSSAHDFFRALEQREITTRHDGELYLQTHQGTYTTQGQTKRHNRLVERMLHEVEALAVLTGLPGATQGAGHADVRAELEPLWRDVLLNQFHDILPGSSIERVNLEARASYTAAEQELEKITARLLPQLPHADPGDGAHADPGAGPGDGEVPTAINLTSFPRREHLRLDGAWHRVDVAPYAAARIQPAGPFDGLSHTADVMANDRLTVRFSPSGEIASVVDATGAEHVADGFNRLAVYDDPRQIPFDAWDIDPGYVDTTPTVLTVTAARASIDGPFVIRHHEYRAPRVTVHQRVILEIGSPVIRFETHVDWHEKHRMLRAEFRPVHYGPQALCEIQFGHIARTTTEHDPAEQAQFEVCAHKWIATSNPGGGFALLNDSKYGHRAKNGLISLNLLRAPTFPDKTADRGTHEFTYAFLPFDPGDVGTVVREAYRLNNPLLPADGIVFDSAVTVSDPGVVIETIKPAEDGSGVVVRLYESLGRGTVCDIRTRLPHTRATFTDLIERPGERTDLTSVAFGPFEIKTILLEQA
ncbi:alpha-mannosidase [Microbacterium terrisoli]|uniref:alpha-mannosidase n=1 Tax=Microbacterium terrisoli TaxID=3242192 RepID=UPI002806104A|nr:glycoside hydrolase family 38 C-terminal domain-containing protein [Microbacterium protaetiae]